MDVGEATFTLGDFLRLKRLSTPTVYNGWEQISAVDRRTTVNRDDVRDFMPQFGAYGRACRDPRRRAEQPGSRARRGCAAPLSRICRERAWPEDPRHQGSRQSEHHRHLCR